MERPTRHRDRVTAEVTRAIELGKGTTFTIHLAIDGAPRAARSDAN